MARTAPRPGTIHRPPTYTFALSIIDPTHSSRSTEPLPIAVPRTRIGRRWLDMPLRRKVLTVVGLVALACLTPFAAGLVLNQRLDAVSDDTREAIDAIEALSAVRTTLQETEFAYQRYGSTGFTDAGEIEALRAEAAALPSRSQDLLEALPPGLASEGRAVVDRAEAMVVQVEAVAEYGAAGTEPADVLDDPDLIELNPDLVDELLVGIETMPAAYAAVDALAVRTSTESGRP